MNRLAQCISDNYRSALLLALLASIGAGLGTCWFRLDFRESQQLFGAAFGIGTLMFLLALLQILRSRHGQNISARQIETFARQQQEMARRRAQLGKAALQLQQQETVHDLAQTFLTETHGLFGTLQGAVYVSGGSTDGRMQLVASYARGDALREELAPGEGLLGECALSGEQRVIETPVDSVWTIQSALGRTAPAAVMMSPVLLNDRLLGAVEIALLTVPETEEREQFEDLVRLLALNLTVLKRTGSASETNRRTP